MKNKQTTLRRKADKLYQLKYRGTECLACGKPAEVVHHFIPKSQSNNLRYDPDNAISLCNSCHFSHHTKGDPHIVSTIIEKNGLEWVNELQNKRSVICKFGIGYLQDKIEELTN